MKAPSVAEPRFTPAALSLSPALILSVIPHILTFSPPSSPGSNARVYVSPPFLGIMGQRAGSHAERKPGL